MRSIIYLTVHIEYCRDPTDKRTNIYMDYNLSSTNRQETSYVKLIIARVS